MGQKKRRPVKVSPARDLAKTDVEYVKRDLGKRPRSRLTHKALLVWWNRFLSSKSSAKRRHPLTYSAHPLTYAAYLNRFLNSKSSAWTLPHLLPRKEVVSSPRFRLLPSRRERGSLHPQRLLLSLQHHPSLFSRFYCSVYLHY